MHAAAKSQSKLLSSLNSETIADLLGSQQKLGTSVSGDANT
jgi:hypothetical protein